MGWDCTGVTCPGKVQIRHMWKSGAFSQKWDSSLWVSTISYPSFLPFQHRCKEKGVPQETRKKGWFLAELSSTCTSVCCYISGVGSTAPCSTLAQLGARQEERMGREGRPGQAGSSILTFLGLKGPSYTNRSSWRMATNHIQGFNVPSCQVNSGILATEIFHVWLSKKVQWTSQWQWPLAGFILVSPCLYCTGESQCKYWKGFTWSRSHWMAALASGVSITSPSFVPSANLLRVHSDRSSGSLTQMQPSTGWPLGYVASDWPPYFHYR